jgi:hypothetical protein
MYLDRPDRRSIQGLVELLVLVERRLAAGPWDQWDGEVLEQWRDVVKRQLDRALAQAIPDVHLSPEYEIVPAEGEATA